jgi:Lipopolysaccharide-assembly
MPFRRSTLRSGIFRTVRALSLLALLALGACITRYGFTGGGLPAHIRTLAILPFENETPSPDLQREIFEAMRRDLDSRLGVRDAPEERADAVVRGVIRTYDVDVPVGFNTNETQAVASRRKLQLTVDVQIVDQTTGKTIFERKGLRAEGEYAERDEAAGRLEAIKRIVNDMIEGAQSQW